MINLNVRTCLIEQIVVRSVTLVYDTFLLFVHKDVTLFSYVYKKIIFGTVMSSSVVMNEETPVKKVM